MLLDWLETRAGVAAQVFVGTLIGVSIANALLGEKPCNNRACGTACDSNPQQLEAAQQPPDRQQISAAEPIQGRLVVQNFARLAVLGDKAPAPERVAESAKPPHGGKHSASAMPKHSIHQLPANPAERKHTPADANDHGDVRRGGTD